MIGLHKPVANLTLIHYTKMIYDYYESFSFNIEVKYLVSKKSFVCITFSTSDFIKFICFRHPYSRKSHKVATSLTSTLISLDNNYN